MTNSNLIEVQKSGQRTAICHFLSLVICQISLCGLCGREKKCSAGFQPAKGRVDAKWSYPGSHAGETPALRFSCVSAVGFFFLVAAMPGQESLVFPVLSVVRESF